MSTAPAAPITPPDALVYAQARSRSDAQAKPLGALGRLEELGCWIAACQGVCPPEPLDDVRVVVFAGDHGVSEHGVSAYPAAVTTAIVAAVAAGRAGINAIAGAHGVRVRAVDVACRDDIPGSDASGAPIGAHKIRRSSEPLHLRDAITLAEAQAALALGDAVAAQEIADGAQLLIVGDVGIGNTTPAAALIAASYGLPAATVTGRGTGLDDAGLAAKTELIATALTRVGDRAADPLTRLAALGSADLAAAVGFVMGAARRGVPLIVDGVIAAAEATLAEALQPGTAAWLRAGHLSPEPACAIALERLGLEPILALGMRLGEGTGAVTAVPIVRTAVAVQRDLAALADLVAQPHPQPEPARA
ncbi:MAG: nicotinate-nucleotide--dimethylbenzimidazole phosphoribosyltransferase [Austwickia sp.]|nr:nicotinate-nucleotide--dimethylbenzimidazole phosphoribosyltransferase [Austwickia sp.]